MWPFKKREANTPQPSGAGLDKMLDAYGIQGADRSSFLESQDLDRQAQSLLAAGNWIDAIACSDRSLKLRPDGWVALGNKTTALLQLGRNKEALTAVDLALQRNPDQADLIVQRGIALVQLGRPQEALTSLDRALQLGPQPAMAQAAQLFRGEARKALGK